jgi:hypothetical protein
MQSGLSTALRSRVVSVSYWTLEPYFQSLTMVHLWTSTILPAAGWRRVQGCMATARSCARAADTPCNSSPKHVMEPAIFTQHTSYSETGRIHSSSPVGPPAAVFHGRLLHKRTAHSMLLILKASYWLCTIEFAVQVWQVSSGYRRGMHIVPGAASVGTRIPGAPCYCPLCCIRMVMSPTPHMAKPA